MPQTDAAKYIGDWHFFRGGRHNIGRPVRYDKT
jgi:hypothetical protein